MFDWVLNTLLTIFNDKNLQTWTNTYFRQCSVSEESSSVIRQKGKSKNECFKKTKHAKFFENELFLTPDTHTYVCVSGGKKSGGKKCSFSENLACFVFLKHPF